MSKLRTRLALTVVGAALLLSALVLLDQHEAAASDTLPSREPAAVPGAPPVHNPSNRAWVDPLNSPQESKQSAIVTVQSLASTEPQVPSAGHLPPRSRIGCTPEQKRRSTAAPSTPARRGPAPTEVAAYIARARAKIQQGDIAAARRLLERASDSDKAEAWFALAETYDPQMLAHGGFSGQARPGEGRTLYQKAEERGAQGARERLLAIRSKARPRTGNGVTSCSTRLRYETHHRLSPRAYPVGPAFTAVLLPRGSTSSRSTAASDARR